MKISIVLAAIVVVIQAGRFSNLEEQQWSSFKFKYNKQYKDGPEEQYRMKIFLDNVRRIELHNQNYEQKLVTYKLTVNWFADLLQHEIVSMRNGYKTKKERDTFDLDAITFIPPANVREPAQVNWTAKGAVTKVKNQLSCGSCYAFAVTGALEGQQFRKIKKLVSLSEQNLVDCSRKYGNGGCNGGSMDISFQYIKENGGIDTEESYPYEALVGSCRYNPQNSGATVSGYVTIKSGSEDDLKSAVATQGPVAVAIDASQSSFYAYSEGVYDDPKCNSTEVGHAALVVGYGTTKSGIDYWIVKNSFGEGWGNRGYILMSRNKNNQCGIATDAVYPIV